MPKTIPCWNCKGPGCELCNGGGVLSVYIQEELDKAVKEKQEECALICENRLYKYWDECAKAIKAMKK